MVHVTLVIADIMMMLIWSGLWAAGWIAGGLALVGLVVVGGAYTVRRLWRGGNQEL